MSNFLWIFIFEVEIERAPVLLCAALSFDLRVPNFNTMRGLTVQTFDPPQDTRVNQGGIQLDHFDHVISNT